MTKGRAILLGCALALGILAAVEVVLRLAGFTREAAPIALRFGYPNPRELAVIFRPDARLFWRMAPGSTFDAEAAVPINRLGYRGPEPAALRPDDLLRVAVMGDSVAFGAASAWPELLKDDLAARGVTVEVLNFGVPGYSIVQGRRQFEDEVAPLRPSVVLIAYGWNDHWLARAGVPDSKLRPPGEAAAAISLFLSRIRIAQAMRAVLAPAAERGTARRVPLAEYGEAVGRFVAEVRAAGGVPIVVGLPSALTAAELPEYLIDGGFTPSADEAISDHARYVAAARSTAQAAGAPFLDAASAFDGDPASFSRDRIHLSEAGHRRMAALAVEPVLAASR